MAAVNSRICTEFGQEEWKEVPGLCGLQVSSLGRVRSRWTRNKRKCNWRILHQNKSKYGYKRVCFDSTLYFVHILVLEAFVGPKPKGFDTRHLDDNKTNNCVENLCWGTRSENIADAIRNGKLPVGSRHYRAKLNEQSVVEIRFRYAEGNVTQEDLARKYGVDRSIISEIISRKRWRQVP